jgi:hypothetical protein
MFRVGQKVVCVDAGPCDWTYQSMLTLGQVYTIRNFDRRGAPLLDGIADFLRSDGEVVGWRKERFRPLTEKKTDMEARNELFRKWETHKEKRVTAPLDEQA